MTKDYAKRYRRRSGSRSGPHVRLWIFTILFFFLFTMGLVYLGKYQQLHPRHIRTISTSKRSVSTSQEKKTKTIPITKPTKPVEFDFYKPISAPPPKAATSETHKVEPKSIKKSDQTKEQTKSVETPPAKTLASTKAGYWLEIATAKSYAEADQQKAQLALLGFESKIKQKDNGQYQIIMGPYKSKAKAQSDIKRLQNNKINSSLQKS